jgi:trans-2,3-dihydro-3-hydroxyanthranilate isomerase
VRTLRFVVVDVFGDGPFSGTPWIVFTDARKLSTERMQELAGELSASGSAFVLPKEGEGQVRVRAFSRSEEIELSPAAVLGAAAVLGGPMQAEVLSVETSSGLVPVRLVREAAKVVFAWMDAPLPRTREAADRDAVLAALGTGAAESVLELEDRGRHLLVALAPGADPESLTPDRARLGALSARSVNLFASGVESARVRSFPVGPGEEPGPLSGACSVAIARELGQAQPLAQDRSFRVQVAGGRRSELSVALSPAADAAIIGIGGGTLVVGRGELALG